MVAVGSTPPVLSLYIATPTLMWLRPVANNVFAAAWTAGMATAVLSKHALTGDATVAARMTRPWARGLARTWGMQVRVFGAEHIDPQGTYVFMANHESHVDIVALFVGLPVQPGFLAKKELRRIPLFGRAMEIGGHVFIDRARRQRAFAAIDEAAQQVSEGRSIVIFPEGTRGHGTAIRGFKKGGFHLAKKAGVPIAPVGIRGSHHVLPKDGTLIRGGPVEVHLGEPISPEHIASLTLDELMGTVRNAISELSGLPSAVASTPARPQRA